MCVVSQARQLQNLHNLRKMFVQDLTTRVKKVPHDYYLVRKTGHIGSLSFSAGISVAAS